MGVTIMADDQAENGLKDDEDKTEETDAFEKLEGEGIRVHDLRMNMKDLAATKIWLIVILTVSKCEFLENCPATNTIRPWLENHCGSQETRSR